MASLCGRRRDPTGRGGGTPGVWSCDRRKPGCHRGSPWVWPKPRPESKEDSMLHKLRKRVEEERGFKIGRASCRERVENGGGGLAVRREPDQTKSQTASTRRT